MPKKRFLNAVGTAAETDNFVRGNPLFSALPETEKDLLLKEGRLCCYPCKQLLFKCGDPVTHCYVLCQGTIQLFHETPEGHEITTDILIAGDVLCATAIFEPAATHCSYALAINNVTVMEFSTGGLRTTAQQYSAISDHFLATLSDYAHQLEIAAENQAHMTATQIIACFLQHVCVKQGFDANGFGLPYRKSLIASRLGVEKATFSRALHKLKEMGITVNGKCVHFHDLPALKKNVCGHCSAQESCCVNKALHVED